MGCIPTTSAVDGGYGFIKDMIRYFSEKPCHFIISPEGRLKPVPWRSGYHYLYIGLETDLE